MIKLVMALHCHQPVGNFDKVFEKAHETCYRPILDILHAHPGIRTGLHFSGPLLEWLDHHRPETIDLLAELAGRDQVEMMSGGFFEPLLASIPVADARGQVAMMNDYLSDRFGRAPKGFWLTERIWDPSLPSALHGTGMEYTVVDDTHFYYAGLKQQQTFGPYVTEKEGRTLKILATPMIMRYLIPFRLVPDVIGHLRYWNDQGYGVAVYGDDGEKFGLWPGTHEWVIKKGWLDQFFTAVEDNGDWLKPVTPSEYLASARPLGRTYLPLASYEEMTEWALPADRSRALEDMIQTLKNENRWDEWRPFVRGGVWDNFLVKYDESNRMHKKAVWLSGRAMAAGNQSARESVWRAQCNCAYWHGVFGGLYLGHLRRAIHENLIRSQESLIHSGGDRLAVKRFDLDKDGLDEFILEGPSLTLGIDPDKGGSLFEICGLNRALNLSDVLTRRPEAYHHKLAGAVYIGDMNPDEVASIHDKVLAKEKDLDRYLVYDGYDRVSLIDHFLDAERDAEALARNDYQEVGDFVLGEYRETASECRVDEAVVELERSGFVRGIPVVVRKAVRLGPGPVMTADYEFSCGSIEPVEAVYGCEFNLTMFSDQDQDRYFMAPEHSRRRETYEYGAEHHLTRFDLIYGADRLKASFGFSRPLAAAFYPLMSVSMSEEGFEKSYQGTSFLFHFPVRLKSDGKEIFRVTLELIEL